MKYLVVLIILASFLPLQSGVGCNMGMESSESEPSCHSTQKAKSKSSNSIFGHKMEQSNYRSDCFFCQSGLCDDVAEARKFAFFNDDEHKYADSQCQPDQRYILPLDIFLMPIQERAPSNKAAPIPILSYDL